MTRKTLRLIGAHEIRVQLGGISRQRVYSITGQEHFPKPVAELAAGKVWLAEEVEAWIKLRRPTLRNSK
ncbi:helix-turn-helix transcriptional regulator [Actinoplanes sp. GCM10030250]|uniref:helix-turn-helix transcriptional regulator n=1 Tax=Actinoplanes sp. GCM10030250 TaxID=3273376 RepID=UPI003606020F